MTAPWRVVVKRRTLMLLAAMAMLAPLLAGFAPPRQPAPTIDLQLDAGFGGRFRPDTWMPLLLSVANDGPDISGELRVRAENNPGLNATTYSVPIDLPRQSRKQVFLYVSVQTLSRQITVELVDARGQILATASRPVLPTNPQDVLAVVVTDSPGGSLDLTAVALGGGATYQANWSADHIPPAASALLGLDVMVFADVDTGRLSVEQQQTIADWVLAGGHLIISGGPNYRLTTAGLVDLLPVDIEGTTPVDDLTPLARFAGRPGDNLREPDVILATGTPRPGAEVLVSIGETPLLIRRTYGAGLVDYLAADPGLEPFRRWAGRAALWDALIFVPQQSPSWADGLQDWAMADRAVRQSPGFALPSVLEIVGMLVTYIIIIGPLNYLVLRLINWRELAWLTIPAVVVIFSVLTYFTGFSLRGTQITLNRLSVVQVWPGSDRARVDGLVGILSPRRSVYRLNAGPGLTLRPLPPEGSGSFNPTLAAITIEQTDHFAARNVLVDASLIAGFTLSGFVDGVPRLQGSAELVYADGLAQRLRGTVTNTTGLTLDGAAVLVNGGVQHLGTLAPGASVAFDLRLTGSQSAPLTLVSGQDTSLSYDSMDVTVQDVMGLDYWPQRSYRPVSEDDRQIRQRQNLLSAVAFDRDFSGGRGDHVFVVGWADVSPLPVDLEGSAWTPQDVALYIFELPVVVSAPEGTVSIPPWLSTWAVARASSVSGMRPYDVTIGGQDRVAFRFTPLPSVQLRTVERLEITARRASPGMARVLVWNWAASRWDLLDLGGGIRARLDDPAPYIGPNNAVEVLVLPEELDTYVTYAQIDVTWYGQF